jgi:hypothetical protein
LGTDPTVLHNLMDGKRVTKVLKNRSVFFGQEGGADALFWCEGIPVNPRSASTPPAAPVPTPPAAPVPVPVPVPASMPMCPTFGQVLSWRVSGKRTLGSVDGRVAHMHNRYG